MIRKLLFLTALVFCLKGNAQLTTVLTFSTTNGRFPQGDLYYDGSYLYGMVPNGANTACSGGCGNIFKIKPDGTGYDTLLNFRATNGNYPYGSLISDGTYLYGMTYGGGSYSAGTVFKIMPNGSNFDTLLNFNTATSGAYPQGSLFYDGSFLYGMTQNGGAHGYGTIFKIMPNGTNYAKLFDFSITTGGHSRGGYLISDGTYLYGMTSSGGAYNHGTIFKIMPNGTNFDTLMSFNGTNGVAPDGSLYYDGTFLYGLAWQGGTNNYGTIFKIKPDGTGDTVLLNFNYTNGNQPYGSLISDGMYLYGMTHGGGSGICGSDGCGTLFRIKPDGTGFDTLLNFNGINGNYPCSSLISDGTYFYGTTQQGGANTVGTVFKFKPTAVGIKQISGNNNQINIYPNPTWGLLNVEGLMLNTTTEIEITDLLGNTLIQHSASSTQHYILDISAMQKGIYFVTLTSGTETSTKKIILNK